MTLVLQAGDRNGAATVQATATRSVLDPYAGTNRIRFAGFALQSQPTNWPAPRQDAIQVTVASSWGAAVTIGLSTEVEQCSSLEIRRFIVHNGFPA